MSQATLGAVPINFRLKSAGDYGGGVLQFYYLWDSSSGNPSDLGDCVVYEDVTYPNGGWSPYVWPKPPWNQTSINPTVNWVPGTDMRFTDFIQPGNIVKPYAENGFTSDQDYRYTCAAGGEVTLQGGITNSRSVTQNANGTWMYYVISRGYADSVNPLP